MRMKVQAKAKFIRISPRKTRLLVDLIRGMSIQEARAQLQVSRKLAATPVLKCLNSAVANAQNNFNQDVSNYKVVEAYVDEGPTISRFRQRAQGRAAAIRKRMSHITIAVGDGITEEVKAPEPAKAEKPAAKKKETTKVAETKDAPKKASVKKSTK
jgi:large subunit ribosomal protein L22